MGSCILFDGCQKQADEFLFRRAEVGGGRAAWRSWQHRTLGIQSISVGRHVTWYGAPYHVSSTLNLRQLTRLSFNCGFSRVEEFTYKNDLRLKRCSNRTDMVNPSPLLLKMLNMP